jgi:hypothetical protein
MFFVLRKEPKDFCFSASDTIEAMAGIYPWAPEVKVFCFFSSEKKTLTYLVWQPNGFQSSGRNPPARLPCGPTHA